MSSNLLSMPLVNITFQTGNYEDWIDTIKYVVGDEFGPQLDLRGIDFEMEVRKTVDLHEVVLSASTADGTIALGSPPNYGFLIFNTKSDVMKQIAAGDYVGDVIGRDDQYTRKCIQFTLEIIEGVTKWPSPA